MLATLLISAVLFKLSWITFKVSGFVRRLANPVERKIGKLVELLKLREASSIDSGKSANSYLVDMQTVLLRRYGDPLTPRAFVKTVWQSFTFCIFFSLWLGVFLFESFSGPFHMIAWPNLLSYFIWTSIVVSLVATLDILAARLLLNLLVVARNRFKRVLIILMLLLTPALFFVIATAIVSGTSMNSLALAKGELTGYWSLHFIFDRFSLLLTQPFVDLGNLKIASTNRFVQTQALTWFAGIGSLSVMSIAAFSVVSERVALGTATWRFAKLFVLRSFVPPHLLSRYLAGAGSFFLVAGLIFAINGL
jgi:hypothetical protein